MNSPKPRVPISRPGTVALCIPTCNQAAFLADAVRSCFAQNYRDAGGDAPEVWVSDDASSDQTARVLDELKREFPSLRAHTHPHNLGIVGNNNWLLAQPDTEFVARLDSDDVLCPDYLARLIELLQAYPAAAYGHAAIEQINGRGEPMRLRLLARATGLQGADEALRAAAQGYRVAANICTFRRAALHEAGFYQSGMRFCEDWDLSVRLADAEWGNVYCEQVLAQYRVWEDADQVRPRRKLDEVEGCIRVFEEALAPAWARRGWDQSELRAQRRALALAHASVLDAPLFQSAERQKLVRLMRELGDSPPLRLRLRLMRMGYGPILRARRNAELALRDRAKFWLHARRQGQQTAPNHASTAGGNS